MGRYSHGVETRGVMTKIITAVAVGTVATAAAPPKNTTIFTARSVNVWTRKNQPKLKPGQVCDVRLKGDTHCDPKNNHENCDFDGGDCCGPVGSTAKGRS